MTDPSLQKESRLTPEQTRSAEEVLHEAPVAFLAMVDQTAGPYVVPVNLAYAPGHLYIHTGPGRKADALATDPRVCVALTSGETFQVGPTPCKDGFAYRSVIVEGRARLLEQRAEREAALRAIIAKYDPPAAHEPLDEAALAATLVYVIDIETMSYKERPRSAAM